MRRSTVVVLPDGEHPGAELTRPLDRDERVVGPGRQVDDREVGARRAPGRTRARSWPASASAPAASTAVARRSCQIRSCARTAIRGRHREAPRARWWKTSRAVTTPVGRPSSTIGMWRKPADGHLVDRERDRVVVAEDDRVRGHEVADAEGVEGLAGGLRDRVAVGEDADEPVVGHDQHAVDLGVLHPRDGRVDGRVRARPSTGAGAPEVVEVLTEQPAMEGRWSACGTSLPTRSAPQLSQVSAPGRFSKPQTGHRFISIASVPRASSRPSTSRRR